MPIIAIAYTSEIAPGLTRSKMEALVLDAARFNGSAGVTGVLLFDGSRFLQYIEGPQDGLEVALSRIVQARSHRQFLELSRGRIEQRAFPYWGMREITVDAACLSGIAGSDWQDAAPRRDGQGGAGAEPAAVPSAMAQLGRVVSMHVSIA